MRFRHQLLIVFGLLAGLGLVRPLAHATPIAFKIIAHPSNPARALKSSVLTQIFLRQVEHWPDKQRILPIDQSAKSEVRAKFSNQILGKSVSAVRNYWHHKIFSGRGVPPKVRSSDEAVLKHVASHPGAIGYVSARAKIAKYQVRLVRVTRSKK